MSILRKLLEMLQATVRDVVLAGVAAASGYLIGQEIPRTGAELKVLLVGALYAGIRAIIGLAAAVLSD